MMRMQYVMLFVVVVAAVVNRSFVKIIMAALCNGASHYIFIPWFLLLLSFFFPRVISAVADWMSFHFISLQISNKGPNGH